MLICFLTHYQKIYGRYKKYLFIGSLIYFISPLLYLLNQMDVIHCLIPELSPAAHGGLASVHQERAAGDDGLEVLSSSQICVFNI